MRVRFDASRAESFGALADRVSRRIDDDLSTKCQPPFAVACMNALRCAQDADVCGVDMQSLCEGSVTGAGHHLRPFGVATVAVNGTGLTGGSLMGFGAGGGAGFGGHGGQSPPKVQPVEFCFDICLSCMRIECARLRPVVGSADAVRRACERGREEAPPSTRMTRPLCPRVCYCR